MSKPSDSAGRGRYRFQGGQPLDPNAGVHPEMATGQDATPVGTGIPNTPEELIAMQENKPERPEKSERQPSAKAKQVLDLIKTLDTSAAEDQEIALTLVRRLESFHDEVVAEMKDDAEAKHSLVAAWAIDADRLMHCRIFLKTSIWSERIMRLQGQGTVSGGVTGCQRVGTAITAAVRSLLGQ